ncbi:YeeE/YedE thiosulfate transporter family protein [Marivirga atlantica]|uniref:YeeE/YedE family protein n=1 Tax=Marivirga atlantica TaxID=1548457 RepID=A0A937DE58_9BACT|nr:YeeE/YedE thiosulfate transporter family protein [Marivirga atlantica]MBL0764912.1 YeeE/YedE family protein [Marivirga atlantica]
MWSSFIEWINQPWPWYVAGPLIAVVMLSLILFGKTFGLSSNLRTMCSILGGGKSCDYFDYDWKQQGWNLVFALGLIIGGFIAHEFMSDNQLIQIAETTAEKLASYDIYVQADELLPSEVFNWSNVLSLQGFIFIVLGGFLVGFGTRYGGGCTSGHAITGLSDLQKASLLATISFFAGGLLITHFVMPYLLNL